MTRNRPGPALLFWVVVVLVVAAFAPTAWPQAPAVEPQALIGQWSGSWVGKHMARTNGQYYLTIERVEGEKVFGKGEYSGRKTTEFKVNGTLSGDRLTFGKTELTVRDNQMAGSNTGMNITLTKEK